METIQTPVATREFSSPASRRVWTFLPLHGKHGEGKAMFIDAADAARVDEHKWTVSPRGYVVRCKWDPEARTSRTTYLHREILGLPRGDERQADHINRDKLDNRRCNLREATHKTNAQNVAGHGSGSKYRNVYRVDNARKPWLANAGLGGKTHYIGLFATEDEAGEAASKWRAEHMPYSEDARKEVA